MQKRIIILQFLICLAVAGFGQSVYDSSNRLIAKIDKSGRVYDHTNSYLGKFSDENIFNWSNFFLGKIRKDGHIYDRNNAFLGKVDNNGRVYDRNNSYLGKVDANGRIYNANNNYLGSAQEIPTRYVAVFFFFNFF